MKPVLILFSCASLFAQEPRTPAVDAPPAPPTEAPGVRGFISTVHEGTQTRSSIEQHASSVNLDLDKERSAVVAQPTPARGSLLSGESASSALTLATSPVIPTTATTPNRSAGNWTLAGDAPGTAFSSAAPRGVTR